MKLYEYKCRQCGKVEEVWSKDTPSKRPQCERCNMPLVRVYTSNKPIFKCDMDR